jgi:hypothetical protein
LIGSLEGTVSLGTLGTQEVTEKLGSRWPLRLRSIAAEDLRIAMYRTLRRVGGGRRYQAVSIFVWPRRDRRVLERQNVLTRVAADEPMPVLFA